MFQNVLKHLTLQCLRLLETLISQSCRKGQEHPKKLGTCVHINKAIAIEQYADGHCKHEFFFYMAGIDLALSFFISPIIWDIEPYKLAKTEDGLFHRIRGRDQDHFRLQSYLRPKLILKQLVVALSRGPARHRCYARPPLHFYVARCLFGILFDP